MKFVQNLSVFAAAFIAFVSTTTWSIKSLADVSDQPKSVLICQESKGGAVVLDGRVELTMFEDQFGQLSVKIVQKDQFSGDQTLGTFLDVEAIDPRANFNGRRKVPDDLYLGNDGEKHMKLSLWNNQTSQKSEGSLVLTNTEDSSRRSVELTCKKI
ncbi:MAG: hypothetical protein NTV34_05515 [Proteobacteria bacterium]|nr:hypothetical protein [Pseudomonadota bacterium]